MTDHVTRQVPNWIKTKWRPAMAWQYFAVCLFDFIIAPVFYTIISVNMQTSIQVWIPLTLQQGGLYHITMAVILGITSWSRGQEKIKGVS